MPPMLRPLRLPQLVEERRRRESIKTDGEPEPSYSFYTFSSTSSELTSPVTPTFSARGHMRHSSSASSFDLALPTTPEYPPSPTRTTEHSGKWALADVQEESPSYDDDEVQDYLDIDDASSDQFDLTDCLREEPRICQATDGDVGQVDMFGSCQDFDYDFDYDFGQPHGFELFRTDIFKDDARSSRKLSRKLEGPLSSFSSRIGSRLPSLNTRRSHRQFSGPISPFTEGSLERYSRLSHGASSRSSSRSAMGYFQSDRASEQPLPPTPDLSSYGSSDSVAKRASSVMEESGDAYETIQRDRAMTTTPLLPPFMNGIAAPPASAINSPLVSPTVAYATIASPSNTQSQPLSHLSSKPSLNSFPSIMASTELPAIPEPDAWSDLLGHANFTISPAPYHPQLSSPDALQKFQEDWDAARVNYTKHLARTGEHYGDTSKTYSLTQAKWSELEQTWSSIHRETITQLIANGAPVPGYVKPDEGVPTTKLPHMAEGKFPERGDQDIVGPMVRQAAMSPATENGRRPSLWRRMTGR